MNYDSYRGINQYCAVLMFLIGTFCIHFPVLANSNENPYTRQRFPAGYSPSGYSDDVLPYILQSDDVISKQDTKSPKRTTILPKIIDMSTWQELSIEDGTICKFDLFNRVCLNPQQAENIGW